MEATNCKRIKVAVFFGGCSSEYSVSLASAGAVIKGLDKNKYEPVLIGITRQGQWLHFKGSPEQIINDSWEASGCCTPAVLSPNRGQRALLLLEPEGVRSVDIDVALPILHGRNGEDGTLQGLLELADIPLAGCGTLASALCMDKDRAHRLAASAGVRVPQAIVLDGALWAAGEPNARAAGKTQNYNLPGSLPLNLPGNLSDRLPLFVKPVKAGSSYGITRVSEPAQLLPAIRLALEYDDQVIIEEAIPGFEVGCAVLGTSTLIVGEVDEIELSGGFFDYDEKYTLKNSFIHVPARIPASKAEEIKLTARKIYRALGCSGFARVDMFLTPEGEIVFNEVNTIPGFTEHSRYPGMMKAAGYSFPQILDFILEQAVIR